MNGVEVVAGVDAVAAVVAAVAAAEGLDAEATVAVGVWVDVVGATVRGGSPTQRDVPGAAVVGSPTHVDVALTCRWAVSPAVPASGAS